MASPPAVALVVQWSKGCYSNQEIAGSIPTLGMCVFNVSEVDSTNACSEMAPHAHVKRSI